MDEDRLRCRRLALDLLGRREHSPLELERKLAARGHSPELVSDVLEDLRAKRLLDTSRFTESFIRAGIAKGQGPVRIRMALRERGVDDPDAAIAEADCDWDALARQTRHKRFGQELPKSYADRAKQSRFLQYRGFTSDQVRNALESADDFDP